MRILIHEHVYIIYSSPRVSSSRLASLPAAVRMRCVQWSLLEMELKVAVVVALSQNFPVTDRGEHDGDICNYTTQRPLCDYCINQSAAPRHT